MNLKTSPAEANQSERLLYLLDKAYEAPFQPDNFHELMKAAHNFYFKSWDDLSVADIKNANFANDATLASHLNRIECRASTTLSARDNHLGRFSGR